MTDWQLEDAAAVEFFKSKGVQIIQLSKAEVDKIKALGAKVFDEHAAKDPLYAKILNSQRVFKESIGAYRDLQSW